MLKLYAVVGAFFALIAGIVSLVMGNWGPVIGGVVGVGWMLVIIAMFEDRKE